MILFAVLFLVVAALPSIWPETFRALHPVKVDTDPENMLPKDEPVRVFHNQMKRELSLHDMIVVGVVNDAHPDGVFNPESLRKIYDLAEYAKTLRWRDEENPDEQVGVIEADMIAPSMVDNIEQGGLGAVKFEWLMASPPTTREEALAVRNKAERIPFLNGTLLSEDGEALCLYLPLTSKDLSYRVYSKLRDKIATLSGDERYFITGLPVAEDTFGVEMFKQMAISAPIAMLVIFVLLLLFFRNLILIISPLIVAVVSVICTMGMLIATGNTVHIMSSMIPIFIMPIAVLDAVHILSEFFDRYQDTKSRRATIAGVMETLFTPMLYTSLTTAAGFASLALTPIPSIQVFGLFVAFGVMLAWLWTVTFIPAFVMLVPE
ncbi:MAG: MMPL family transporter, partial [Candidatus Hydrogenedentota bacterium]